MFGSTLSLGPVVFDCECRYPLRHRGLPPSKSVHNRPGKKQSASKTQPASAHLIEVLPSVRVLVREMTREKLPEFVADDLLAPTSRTTSACLAQGSSMLSGSLGASRGVGRAHEVRPPPRRLHRHLVEAHLVGERVEAATASTPVSRTPQLGGSRGSPSV